MIDKTERDARMPVMASRRQFVLGTAALMACAAMPFPSFAATSAAQQIADHFSSVRTMMGEFVQFGPRGEQTGGKFFIERPGKLRFNYEKPSPMRVISDGKNVVRPGISIRSTRRRSACCSPSASISETRWFAM